MSLTAVQIHALTNDLEAECSRLRQSNQALAERASVYLHMGLPLAHVLRALGLSEEDWNPEFLT